MPVRAVDKLGSQSINRVSARTRLSTGGNHPLHTRELPCLLCTLNGMLSSPAAAISDRNAFESDEASAIT